MKAEVAAKEVARAAGSKSTVPFYAADLASLDETKGLAQKIQKDHPSLNILVNNAGEFLLALYMGLVSPSLNLQQGTADCVEGRQGMLL